MISRAEQQFVAKMPSGPELDNLVVQHVCSLGKIKARINASLATKTDLIWDAHYNFTLNSLKDHVPVSKDLGMATFLLAALGEQSYVARSKEHDMWEIHIGSAKKVTEMTGSDLAATLCKALVIYVRKFC